MSCEDGSKRSPRGRIEVTHRPDVRALERELRRLCDDAPDLGSALEGLLEFAATVGGARRGLAAARLGKRTEWRARGVPRQGSPTPVAILDGHLQAPDGELPPEIDLRSWGTFRTYPFGDPDRGFRAVLLVEAPCEEDGFDSALPAAVPGLARLAQLEIMRDKLEEADALLLDFNTVFDAIPDPVMVLDAQERISLANRRAELLFQAAEGDSEGRRRAVQTNNLFFSAFRAHSALGEGGGGDRELVLVDPDDGSDLLCEVTAVFGDARSRDPSRVVYNLRDITDLKRAAGELETHYRRLLAAEHQLRRETKRLNVIIENAGVPILVTDEESDIVLLNREAERLFEVAPTGADAATDFHSVRTNDAVLTGLISNFLLQPKSRQEEEVKLTDPEREEPFPVRVTLTKIASERREPAAVVSVLHDLTSEAENEALARKLSTLNAELEERVEEAVSELAQRNQELEEQREELAKASRLKTEFLAMMSHELRTPLASILGYGSLLSEGLLGDLTPDQERALAKTRAASQHLLSLINDILDLTKVEAGKMALSLEPVSVRTFMAEFEETCHPLLEGASLEFEVDVEADLPPMRVDPTRLRQVLLNLVSNAVKFTNEGWVQVRVGLVDPGKRIRFEVEDTGIGIEEKNLEVVFEGFRQLEEFPTREQKGTGLGLAISRKLVDLMGGSLQVRSTHGEGSTFWFSVPRADQARSDEATQAADGQDVSMAADSEGVAEREGEAEGPAATVNRHP